jgi:hypothetical protein
MTREILPKFKMKCNLNYFKHSFRALFLYLFTCGKFVSDC